MAEADWTAFNATTHKGLDSGDVSKGVSSAFTGPNGGGSFQHQFHSLNPTIGVAGWYHNGASFNPIATGKAGVVSGALRRYSAGTGYAPIIGLVAGTDLLTSKGYILGLSDSDPYQIVLRKGLLTGGLSPNASDVLRVSDESWSANTTWLHIKLDVIVNPHGDVVLNVFQNDLDQHSVAVPTWTAIAGMDPFIDDAGGVLAGAPETSGFRCFFGMYNDGEAGKVALLDQVRVQRQINP